LRALTHRSGKLAFDEKADIDIRDLLDDDFRDCLEAFDEKADIDIRDLLYDDFRDCLEEMSLRVDEDSFAPELGTTDEDSESSDGRGCLGAGLLFGATAAGVTGMLERARENEDDLGAVVSEVVDVDDINMSMGLGSDAYKASMESTRNMVGPANIPT
jgi:hypothetical protein